MKYIKIVVMTVFLITAIGVTAKWWHMQSIKIYNNTDKKVRVKISLVSAKDKKFEIEPKKSKTKDTSSAFTKIEVWVPGSDGSETKVVRKFAHQTAGYQGLILEKNGKYVIKSGRMGKKGPIFFE